MLFRSEMDQIPPMYSAIKINGKKLYELARKGEVVEREARRITIHSIRIQFIDLEKQQVGIYVRVSKGTYIRSLCDDIGKKLGCGACMGKLIRTRSGSFEMKDSIRLEELSDIILNGSLEQHITHINEVFAIPHILLKPEYDRLVMNGNEITTGMLSDNYVEASQKAFLRLSGNCICVYLSNQTFAAVYQCIEDENNGNIYRIYKMFL